METRSQSLLELLQSGDDHAATEVFERYVRRLVDLARSRVSPALGRRVDPEDVVQSAYRSFFMHARNGDYVWRRAGDLWRLLAAITLHKLHRQVEIHTAQRRTIRRETTTDGADHDLVAASAASRDPTPDEATAIVEELTRVLARRSRAERQVLEMRLQGVSIEDIAERIERSQRSVRRVLLAIEQDLTRELARDR